VKHWPDFLTLGGAGLKSVISLLPHGREFQYIVRYLQNPQAFHKIIGHLAGCHLLSVFTPGNAPLPTLRELPY